MDLNTYISDNISLSLRRKYNQCCLFMVQFPNIVVHAPTNVLYTELKPNFNIIPSIARTKRQVKLCVISVAMVISAMTPDNFPSRRSKHTLHHRSQKSSEPCGTP